MFSIYMLLLRMAAGAEREMLPGAQRWSDEGEGEGEGTGDDVAPPSPVPAPVPPPPASLVVSRASIAKVVAEFADDTSAQTSLLRFITARTATSNVPRLFDWLQVNEVRGCGGAGCGDGWGAATGGVRRRAGCGNGRGAATGGHAQVWSIETLGAVCLSPPTSWSTGARADFSIIHTVAKEHTARLTNAGRDVRKRHIDTGGAAGAAPPPPPRRLRGPD